MGESFTIQISSDLVRQLADEGEKSKKKTRRSRTKVPRKPLQSEPQVQQKPSPDDSEVLKGPGAAGWPLQPPLFLPVPPPQQSVNAELEEIRSILQESEKVIEKVRKQEENMVQEVTQKAKDLHDKEFKLPNQKPMPCLAEKDACAECYNEHVKEPLKCAPFVKSFEDCVRRARQHLSAADK